LRFVKHRRGDYCAACTMGEKSEYGFARRINYYILLIGAIRRAGTDGAKREEGVEDTLIDEI